MATARGQMVRWGNSLAVRIPKTVAEAAKLREGDELVLETKAQGAVALRAVERPLTIEELVAKITAKNCHGEEDWGPAGGDEIW